MGRILTDRWAADMAFQPDLPGKVSLSLPRPSKSEQLSGRVWKGAIGVNIWPGWWGVLLAAF